MKLITSLPNYNQARHQASVATMSASQLPNAHTPQADAQRSGGSNSSYFRTGGLLVTSLFFLGLQYFSAYVERNTLLFKILTNPSNCERSISMVKGHLNSVDPKNVKHFSDSVQEEAKNEHSRASKILEEITKNCNEETVTR
jgi:hypothetical protein